MALRAPARGTRPTQRRGVKDVGRSGYRRRAALAGATGQRRRGQTERVVALIDRRECTVASVRHAIPLATRLGVPVEVLLVQPDPSPLMAANALGMLAIGAVAQLEDDLEEECFAVVARIIAPSRTSWTFATVPPHLARASAWPEQDVTLVVARHPRRFRGGRSVATARSVHAGSDAGARLLVVRCDHHPGRIETPAPTSL